MVYALLDNASYLKQSSQEVCMAKKLYFRENASWSMCETISWVMA